MTRPLGRRFAALLLLTLVQGAAFVGCTVDLIASPDTSDGGADGHGDSNPSGIDGAAVVDAIAGESDATEQGALDASDRPDTGVVSDAALEGATIDAALPYTFGCAAQFGERAAERFASAAVDIDGNVIVTGFNSGPLELGGIKFPPHDSRASDATAFMAKFDRSCQLVFARSVPAANGAVAPLVQTDGQGNIVLMSRGFNLSKLSPSGALLWQTNMTGNTTWRLLATSSNGRSLVEGGSLAVVDADGTRLYGLTRRTEGANGAALDPNGSIYFLGVCKWGEYLPLGPACPLTTGETYRYLAKTKPDGTGLLWYRSIGSDLPFAKVARSPRGGLVLVDNTKVAKIPDAPTGVLWSKPFSTERRSSPLFSVADSGDILLAGKLDSALSFDGVSIAAYAEAEWEEDGFFLRITDDGTYRTSGRYRNVDVRHAAIEPIANEVVLVAEVKDRFDVGDSVRRSAYYDSTDIAFVRSPDPNAPDPGARPADVGGTPETLATGLFASLIPAIETDGTHVYFTDESPYRVYRCPATGCVGAPETLVNWGLYCPIRNFTYNGGAFVYVGGGSTSCSPPAGACISFGGTCAFPPANAPLVTSSAKIVMDAERLYFAGRIPSVRDANDIYVCRRGTTCTTPVRFASGVPTNTTAVPTLVALDGTQLFFNVTGSSSVPSGLFTCPTSGCTSAPTRVAAVARDRCHLAGSKLVCDQLGCDVGACDATLTAIHGSNGGAFLRNVVHDGTNIYFVQATPRTGAANIVTCPIAGCPHEPTVLATGQSPAALAIDGTHVYWIDKVIGAPSSLRRIAK